METHRPWDWRLTVPQTTMLVRPPLTNFKMMVKADCAVSACTPPRAPPLLSIETLVPWLQGGGVGLWTGVYPILWPPPFQLLASKIKQTFPSTSLGFLLAFEQRAAGPGFHNIRKYIIYYGINSNKWIQKSGPGWRHGCCFLALCLTQKDPNQNLPETEPA